MATHATTPTNVRAGNADAVGAYRDPKDRGTNTTAWVIGIIVALLLIGLVIWWLANAADEPEVPVTAHLDVPVHLASIELIETPYREDMAA